LWQQYCVLWKWRGNENITIHEWQLLETTLHWIHCQTRASHGACCWKQWNWRRTCYKLNLQNGIWDDSVKDVKGCKSTNLPWYSKCHSYYGK
jgi:hypothetical protein